MATPAQIAANRANARLSTGPVTEDGKKKSSSNALKHGFYSRQFIVAEDEQEDFELFLETLLEEINPTGPLAVNLFVQLLHAAWNLHRLQRLEAEILAQGAAAFTDERLAAQLDRLARHAARFERSYHRTLKALREQVTNQVLHYTLPELVREQVPLVCSAIQLHRGRRLRKTAWPDDDYIRKYAERTLKGSPPPPEPAKAAAA